MIAKNPDRRIIKTRTAIHDALLSLMSEKQYNRIIAEDFNERADVGRFTF